MGLGEKLRWAAGLKAKLEQARAQSGKSIITQLGEIRRLYREAEQFGIDDYFDYRVYAPDWQGEQKAVAGWRMLNWLDDRLNPRPWRNLVFDKLVMYAIMASHELPIPPILAVYQQQGRGFQDAARFTRGIDLCDALRSDFPYPCFLKPVYGDVGAGSLAIAGYDGESDSLVLTNGERRGLEEVVAGLDARRKYVQPIYGYLFQELLTLHPSLVPVCGERIASVRIIVLMHDEGPEPISATWKVVVGNNMNDNYDGGRTGNLLASVDIRSGRVERAVHGYGPALKLFPEHPDSHRPLAGLQLPDWPAALELVKRGARAFPMLRFQHWDIALTAAGPEVLEVNVTGGLDGIQFASGRGLYDERLRNFVARYGQF